MITVFRKCDEKRVRDVLLLSFDTVFSMGDSHGEYCSAEPLMEDTISLVRRCVFNARSSSQSRKDSVGVGI